MFLGGASRKKEYTYEAKDRSMAEVAMACKAVDMSRIPFNADVLHADTLPENIARDQRECVQQYLNLFGFTTIEAISEEVILPVSVVTRRLVELKVLRPCQKKKPKFQKKQDRGEKMFRPAPVAV